MMDGCGVGVEGSLRLELERCRQVEPRWNLSGGRSARARAKPRFPRLNCGEPNYAKCTSATNFLQSIETRKGRAHASIMAGMMFKNWSLIVLN